MSFILDALRKSETERQRQGSAEFAGVPTSAVSTGAPRWLWIVAALLAVNLAVLIGLLMRPEAGPAETVAAPVSAAVVPDTASATSPAAAADDKERFIEQVAAARQTVPLQSEAPEPTPQVAEPAETVSVPVANNSGDSAVLPTFVQVLTSGAVQLPDLHLDIHVYSDVPEDRFVFINMSKLRENSQLSEGPVVEQITPEGVILDHLGTRFLLTRD